jgi:uncharacterized membrane protein
MYARVSLTQPIATHSAVKLFGGFLEKKIFWAIFMVLGLIADFTLPLMWSLILTLPILVLSWWIAYRSEWFS